MRNYNYRTVSLPATAVGENTLGTIDVRPGERIVSIYNTAVTYCRLEALLEESFEATEDGKPTEEALAQWQQESEEGWNRHHQIFSSTSSLSEQLEAMAALCIYFEDRVQKMVENLSDDALCALAVKLRETAALSFGRLTMRDEIVKILGRSRWMRTVAAKAEASGVKVYCVFCEGECRDDHEERMDAEAFNKPMQTSNEIRWRSLSRDDLLAELKELERQEMERAAT